LTNVLEMIFKGHPLYLPISSSWQEIKHMDMRSWWNCGGFCCQLIMLAHSTRSSADADKPPDAMLYNRVSRYIFW